MDKNTIRQKINTQKANENHVPDKLFVTNLRKQIDNNANVSVYKFKDTDSFVNAAKKRSSYPYWSYIIPEKIIDNKSDLSKVLSVSTQIRENNNRSIFLKNLCDYNDF